MTRPGDELLSAHFDGELADEERQVIETLLRESPAARVELSEIARLSELLRELPDEPAPPGLRQSVMEATGRTTAALPRAVSRSRWILALSGLALSALAVLTVFRWTSDEPQSVAIRETNLDSAETAGNPAAGPTLDSAPPLPGSGLASENGSSAADFAGRAGGGFGGESAETDRALAMRAAAGAAPPADGVVLGERAVRLRRVPQVGEILRLTGGDAQRVAVIEVTVVDKQEAFDGLQLLLAAHAIPPRRDAGKVADEKVADDKVGGTEPAAPPPEVREGELWAVYAQASDEALATTLTAMQSRDVFRAVRVTSAVPLETVLTRDSGANGAVDAKAVQGNKPHPAAALVAAPEPRDPPAVAQRRNSAPTERESAASFQLALRGQPADRFAPTPAEPEADDIADRDPNARADDSKPRTEAEPSGVPRLLAGPAESKREPRLLRVLFVLRSEAAPARR